TPITMRQEYRRACSATALLSALFFCVTSAAAADDATTCDGPIDLVRLERPLVHVGARLAAREPVKIVAIGSSSTAGAGASSPNASYPTRLAAELNRLYPDVPVIVLNRGVNGQDAAEMLVRFRQDVIDEKPDLVIWQLGTNAALRDLPIEEIGKLIREGIQEIKDAGADVLLVDPQFAPKVIAKPEAEGMVQLIATTANSTKVNIFRRFAVMRHWHERGGMSFDAFTSPDGLHMNDWGYGCWAKLLCTAISDAAKRAVTSAHASPAVIRPNNRPATQ
ncbi:MAG: SGNH/GDSL hydrolase family protein, partial [Xanthobacteraceae bacterium]